jgi:hypothetical protein
MLGNNAAVRLGLLKSTWFVFAVLLHNPLTVIECRRFSLSFIYYMHVRPSANLLDSSLSSKQNHSQRRS